MPPQVRFFHARNFLRAHARRFRRVILADVRDIMLQVRVCMPARVCPAPAPERPHVRAIAPLISTNIQHVHTTSPLTHHVHAAWPDPTYMCACASASR